MEPWAGAVVDAPAFSFSRRVFLALLGLCYVSAFASFAVQGRGLVGPEGVLPLWPSDGLLIAACAAGIGCGLLLIHGRWPRVPAVIAYLLYAAVVYLGGPFLGFQWDILLLETGFLAAFVASGKRPPPVIGVWLLRLLLFKLMFLSGVVKLASGDPTWRGLSGLQYHYWSQPLPTWSAYFADLAPPWFDRICEAVMFAIELGAPLLLFGPRRLRHAGAAAIAFLQLCIAATGNYGFFNLLTAALCAMQVDDAAWRRPEAATAAAPRPGWARVGWAVLAALWVLTGSIEVWRRFGGRGELPEWADVALEWADPLHASNTYGLFAVMTTGREEIDLEGSSDGKEWKRYRFRYKPGALDERPRFAPLHMPRLDWQMWFASLGSWRSNQWLLLLQRRLLEGKPAVRALFAEDPFPDAPPRYLRTRIAPYRFAPFADWRARGAWWTRGPERPYGPTVALENGRLVAVGDAGEAE